MAMDRDDVIKKVQDLWRLADHPNTGEHERDTAINMARNLMAKYQIDQLVLNEASEVREAVIMKDIRLTQHDRKTLVKTQRIALAHQIAIHNRCRAVIVDKMATADVATGKPIPGGEFMTVIGYSSDVAMVEELFVSLAWALLEALMDEQVTTDNYRENFATGFVDRIRVRLGEINRRVHQLADETAGVGLVLRSREAAVDDEMTKMFPNLTTYKVSSRTKFDPNAHERGTRAANSVDVGATKLGGGDRGQLNQ